MDKLYMEQLRELVIKGEKLQAVKLVMQQTNMGLKEAKDYVDNYCLQEKIGVTDPNSSYSPITSQNTSLGTNYPMPDPGTSYSAITAENGSTVYYKTENGEKHIISKEEAPKFLVNAIQSRTNGSRTAFYQQNNVPNHKKGNKILTYMSIPFFALGIFFLYRICIDKSYTFDNISGAIACGAEIIVVYFIKLMLWLDESIARRRQKKAEEIEIPFTFMINGRAAKRIFFIIDLFIFVFISILLYFTVTIFFEKNYLRGSLTIAFLVYIIFCSTSAFIRDLKNSKLSLRISGKTISLCQNNDEIAIIPAETSKCVFSCSSKKFYKDDWFRLEMERPRVYPRAFFFNTDGSLLAEIFLDLQEYHLLKKYLIQQGASVTDEYNRF